jgi:hypothetical protein
MGGDKNTGPVVHAIAVTVTEFPKGQPALDYGDRDYGDSYRIGLW